MSSDPKPQDLDSGVESPEVASNEVDPISTQEVLRNILTVPSIENSNQSESDEEEFTDESLAERLWGLTEMFPESARSFTYKSSELALSLLKGTYSLTRQAAWVISSTAIIMFAPVVFEVERFNIQEMARLDRNRLVLGPGSVGPPGSHMPGPIPG